MSSDHYEKTQLLQDLEHHKNILIGLNEKLTVYNDLKLDCEANRQAFAESESARGAL
jgi:hypothetical protein